MRNFFYRIAAAGLLISLTACGIFDQKDKTLGWSADQLYAEAKEERQAGNFDSAAKYLEKLEARYPFGTYAQQAQMDLAHLYYVQNDKQQALSTIDRFLKAYPNHRNADYMLYLRGLVDFGSRNSLFDMFSSQDFTERDPQAMRDSFDSFKLLVEKYPESSYAEDAILRMKYLINAMTQYELHVANYYLRRGIYLSAINRAQRVIKDYPDSPANQEALQIMVTSYDKMGEKQLRDDTQRILDKNFANKQAGQKKDDSPWWKLW